MRSLPKSALRRILPGALFLFATASCGGTSTSPTPAPQPTPPTPPAPTTTWSIAGRLVETVGGQPISGAQLAPTFNQPAVSSGSDGSFLLSGTTNPPNPYRLSVSGSGLVSHDIWLTFSQGARTNVTLDAIRNNAPFSMDFYRQFVRGTFDQPGAPFAVLRWTDSNPRFFVKTIDQNGRPVEPEVLAVIRDAIQRAVPAFTANKLSAAAIESGTEDRPSTPGWINVVIRRDPNEKVTCGFAFIGANPGTITLNDDVCSCGSNKIPGAVVLHEVGHALGFFHVSDRGSIMFPFVAGNCPAGVLSAAEQYHSGIAYSRPRGNTDPDVDPSSAAAVTTSQLIRSDR